MSRIFDALQRSGTEQSGIEYPDMLSVATEVFEAPKRQPPTDRAIPEPVLTSQEPAIQIPVAQVPVVEIPIADVPVEDRANETPGEFPSLEVSVTPASRLVYFTEPDSLAAEKFRFLGVRLRQLRQSPETRERHKRGSFDRQARSCRPPRLHRVEENLRRRR